MLKNLITSALLILSPFFSEGQFKNAPKINAGIARRPELFELTNYYVRGGAGKGYQSNIGRMNKPSLAFEISQRLNNERWILELSNYLSSNYLATVYDSMNYYHKDISAFKYDIFFDGLYEVRFRKFKKTFIYIGAGVGRMNISKKFDYNYPTGKFDSSGNWLYEKKSTSLSFWAPRILFGVAYKNLSAFVIAHSTPDGDFNRKLSLWVEYKLLYSFNLKKKK